MLLESVALRLVNTMKRRAPADTGHLRASINYNIVTDSEAEFSMLDYGRYVEYGTPPHIIEPKNREALAFEPGKKARLESGGKKGATVFAKKVNHPGTRPQPFIRPTFRDDFGNILVEEVKSVLK